MAAKGGIPEWVYWVGGITGAAFLLGLFNRQRVISNMENKILGPNFNLSEFVHTSTGLDNIPPPEAVAALESLVMNVLQPLRNAVVKRYPGATVSIGINSGYRSPEVNAATGGSSSTSQHMKGEAADIRVMVNGTQLLNQTVIDIARAERLPYDQIIDEQLKGKRWVHISHSYQGKQRTQWLTARDSATGGTAYVTVKYGYA